MRIAALGGGHGLAVVLRAARTMTEDITAVVTVADDGGSSGRLRRDLDIIAPGDLRRCLVALARNGVWATAYEHRFRGGELDGHALGNLVIVGLLETLGDPVTALAEAARVVDTVGRVLPATTRPVVLVADIDGAAVHGQVAIQGSKGRIGAVRVVPGDAAAPAPVLAAIAAADLVVLAPGSLYTSLLPVVCVSDIGAALRATSAHVVQVANLRNEIPETDGLDPLDHLRAVLDHGGRVDSFLFPEPGDLVVDTEAVRSLGAAPVAGAVATPSGLVHDPARLATALLAVLES